MTWHSGLGFQYPQTPPPMLPPVYWSPDANTQVIQGPVLDWPPGSSVLGPPPGTPVGGSGWYATPGTVTQGGVVMQATEPGGYLAPTGYTPPGATVLGPPPGTPGTVAPPPGGFKFLGHGLLFWGIVVGGGLWLFKGKK
jgi:hypothetical protein